jgi:aspartokinase/homoserine dehydrogenase 2
MVYPLNLNKIQHPFKQLSLPKTIYKFGGSSLANAKCYRKVAQLVTRHLSANDLVVVSASASTTDWLVQITERPSQLKQALLKLKLHHHSVIEDCLHVERRQPLLQQIDQAIHWIKRLSTLNQIDQFSNDILALGELWSAQILCALLEQQGVGASWIDARQCLKLQWKKGGYQLDAHASQSYLFELLKSRQNRISIVTGYIASNCENQTVTLGRNGSDYTATLLAALCNVEQVCIWTDVAGIYDFDPHLADDAKPIAHINRRLIQKLSELGSPVLHHQTLQPITDQNCHLSIRSTFAPELSGTQICQSNRFQQNAIVTHKNGLARFCIKGSSEIACQRLINDLQHHAHQVTHEFLLCLKLATNEFEMIIDKSRIDYWQQWLTTTQQQQSYICGFSLKANASLLALVTEDSDHRPFHKYFFTKFIQSYPNHSGVIQHNNAYLCLFDKEAIDDYALSCFRQWQNYRNTCSIFLIGTGNVGKTWFAQWQRLPHDRETLVLSANSKQIHLRDHDTLIGQYDNQGEQLKHLIAQAPFEKKIVIDATASETIADLYPWVFSNGIHLISANKIASSSSEKQYRTLNEMAQAHHVFWRQNATIGAGLPINHALNDLLKCGDSLISIRGVFSGTLSWLLQNYNAQGSLTELIKRAQQLGLSEPDPRIDLSGQDVARKLVIAARLAGFKLELNEIHSTPVINASFLNDDLASFWQQSQSIDQAFHAQWLSAHQQGKTLVYQAEFSPSQGAYCALVAVDNSDPLAQISPCDNIFVIKTQWYNHNPLIIRGPGAGREVTAAAIQSDLNAINLSLNNEVRERPFKLSS